MMLPVQGQQYLDYNYPVLNFGFRLGLNALYNTNCNLYSEKTELTNKSFLNESGYDINTFLRINLDRIFMQPELEWSLYRQKISFSSENSDKLFSMKTQAAKVNVLAGYYFTKNGPFLFSFICGSSFHYYFNTSFNTSFQSKTPHFVPYGLAGFSINISNIYFDVRYGISFFNTNISFDEIPDIPESLKGISLDKKENILNFSCGLIF
ncbi:MAG: outer membrane beta-barrel protein [Dysgonamonadaceae bacterium]|nr:outer membrane beta-barrel protein [Dysgonamonadaceae bacterium]